MSKNYIIVKGDEVIARCYGKSELIKAVKDYLNIEFKREYEDGEHGEWIKTVVTVWISGRKTSHSYTYDKPMLKAAVDMNITEDMLRSSWFYKETGIEFFESCTPLS